MFPVLLSIGKISISSYGVFLAIGFLTSLFLIWRLARAWDLNEEKVLDLSLLTFLGGILGARIYFVLENFSLFSQNLYSVILFNKVPGFSFWGAFLGGWLTLYFFSRRKRMDFWQLTDIASVGLIFGLILSDLGCFFGGCNIGIQSNLFFSVGMVGALGKRFPVQLLEAALLYLIFLKLWGKVKHFHQRGFIAGLSLIYIGIVKFLTEALRQNHNTGTILDVVLIVLGINILVKITKRDLKADLKNFKQNFTLANVLKYWYNQKTAVYWSLRNFRKNLRKSDFLRRVNVRISYKNNKLY